MAESEKTEIALCQCTGCGETFKTRGIALELVKHGRPGWCTVVGHPVLCTILSIIQ